MSSAPAASSATSSSARSVPATLVPTSSAADEQGSAAVVAELLRPDLRGGSPYGAPQLEVPVALNTNENSYDVPPEVVDDITAATQAAARTLNRYPDREFTALRDDLAAYLHRVGGVPLTREQIWAANGSNEVLLHLLQAFGGPGRTALGFTPSYSMHPIITRTTGTTWIDGHRGVARALSSASTSQTPGAPGSDDHDSSAGVAHLFDLDIDDVLAQVRTHDPHLIFLCSPNNPTGTALSLDLVRAVHDAAPRAVVIVDEAYAEFARSGTPSAVTLLDGRPRLVVSRTMSKAFALAGGRLGYLAADPAVTAALRLVRMPYHLSAITQAVARAALGHADLLLSTVEVIKGQRDRIVAELTEIGLHPVPSDANFVLFGGLADAPTWWQAMLDRGVLIRDVGIPGFLRVTAGTPEETTAFLDAARQVHAGARPGDGSGTGRSNTSTTSTSSNASDRETS